MTAITIKTEIRDAVFEHEVFNAGNINSWYALEAIRGVEATWTFSEPELGEELTRLEREGLVLRRSGFGGDVREYWGATHTGKIAREARWQERGRRHPTLSTQVASAEDLAIALIASGGEELDLPTGSGLTDTTLSIYLRHPNETASEAMVNELIAKGLVRREDEDLMNWPFRLTLTADGRRHYAREIVPRLGLQPPATILAPTTPEPVPFDDLGLESNLADNLRYRWEEAARCTGARAWLAATALYASILEVVLPDWLSRDIERAKAAVAAPRDRRSQQVLPLEAWPLGAADENLDYLEVVHVLVRRPHASGPALFEVG
ncbi:hypothetical protein HDG34_006115 [Paraburkholderia sp. HC6.4b]|uniref:hypothetical protein n=1 Tax=unclassified Paraburkholderia TaxID=2615204 RepID=UPI00161829FA|nr:MULTISPECIES: hypothetical protein [unclassified Paraburkholderia]MBB5412144.1 hypothetical protein [Paraburkholderia sp. HC6.4b]MBB5454211.1 hypothetical protein [Paraburkholderia sp. Kb1A]